MQRFSSILTLSLVITLLVSGVVLGQDKAPALESGPAGATAEALSAPMTPFALLINEIREGTMAHVVDLSARIEQLDPGSPEIIELQAEIWQAKQDCEIAVLQAIIRDAREAGDEARRTEAESALDHIVHPESYKAPTISVERPIPSGH